MSIEINGTYIKSHDVPDIIRIGSEEFTMTEFCDIAEYVFTNTDLEDNDPRVELMLRTDCRRYVAGYNDGKKRILLED